MKRLLVAIALLACGGKGPSSTGAAGDAAKQACAYAVSCFGGQYDCASLAYVGDAKIACLATAGSDCPKLQSCLGVSITSDASCSGTRCDGSHLVQCAGGTRTDVDCARDSAGATCLQGATTVACGIGSCTNGDPDRCDGTRVLTCQDGVLSPTDCALSGLTCVTLVDGSPVCGGDGETCDSDVEAAHCEGNQRVGCIGGHIARHDCSKLLAGGRCLTSGDAVFCGFAADCAPGQSRCDGSVLDLCAFGAHERIDCAAAGFAGCTDDQTNAWCVSR